MYANEIEAFLKKYPAIIASFQGFHACDKIPDELEEGAFFIGNTEYVFSNFLLFTLKKINF